LKAHFEMKARRPETEAPVRKDLEPVLSFYAKAESRIDEHQRLVERLTEAIGRAHTVYFIVAVAAIWMAYNVFASRLHLTSFDPPPFQWLQGLVGLAALVTTTMVLTTQNRQGRHAEHRSALDLQVNLVAEQKVAKLIALVEELRRDLPNVRNRKDPVADAMTRAVDPEMVSSILEESIGLGDPAGSGPPQAKSPESTTDAPKGGHRE
jgi:uncharacterized membrane protein